VRAIFGRRIGVASTKDLGEAGVREVVERAAAVARLQPENPDFQSLPRPAAISPVDGYRRRTAECTPQDRADLVGVICARAKARGLTGAGNCETAAYEFAVANSLGVEVYYQGTEASAHAVALAEDGSGYGAQASCDFGDLDGEAIAGEAVERALRARGPIVVEQGDYEVILGEYAVAEMLEILAYLGFGAKTVQEGTSFLCGKLGQRIVGENITIIDDGLDPRGLLMPFDFEGVPKQRVALIEQGIARGMVYDSLTAGKEGRASTGHALPAPNPFGPLPTNLFMGAGSATLEDMIRSVKRGIWVNRFWYTNPVHPLTTVTTGMTRDGTFLIEAGKVVGPIRNLRFTQSYLEALNQVELIGREAKLVRGEYLTACVPALKIAKFHFSSVTEY
ncbi:MAG: TldD/PmbA family protein, partial [Chloroflexi bacterium]|nr:TldD/PmbA family protein [Chloroflexota bacterium]